MDNETQEIVHRFEEFGKKLCGSQHGWKKKFADRLGVKPTQITSMLNGNDPIGGTMQTRLRDLGADVDYIMTGRLPSDKKDDKSIRIHYRGKPSEEFQLRIQRLAEWILEYGQNADTAYIGYVSQKFMEGKILDANGKEINK
jgi:transcriptional regulator with XRE-family HTH domain